MSFLLRFDIYRKVPTDLTKRTSSGALISVLSILFVSFLFCFEFLQFIGMNIATELVVEDPVQGQALKIPVTINISLPKMECKYIGIDIVDEMKRHDVGYQDATKTFPIGHNNAGCRIESRFAIRKIPGNFHISTHSSTEQPKNIDMAHVIHGIYFGSTLRLKQNVKGSFNPIENVDKLDANAISTHSYVLTIVPTAYEDIEGGLLHPYQYTYSYTNLMIENKRGPIILFQHKISPITVRYTVKRNPFYTFLTKICAIVGGTFTVAGIFNSFVYTAADVFKKAQLGKLN